MTLSFSAILVCVALVIYIYDSVVFLYLDEGILTRDLRGQFTYDFATNRFVVLGKLLIIQNLLAPYRPVFRLSWAPPANGVYERSNANNVRRISGRLLRLAPFVWVMSVSLFIAVPVGMLILHNWGVVILALAEFYLSAIIVIIMMVVQRKSLEITLKDIASVSLESLICPPCGLNIIRKVSWRIKLNGNIVNLSNRLMTDNNYRACLQELNQKIDRELESLDEKDELFNRFNSYKARVRKELS